MWAKEPNLVEDGVQMPSREGKLMKGLGHVPACNVPLYECILPPWELCVVGFPAQHPRRTNAFTAMRGDKMMGKMNRNDCSGRCVAAIGDAAFFQISWMLICSMCLCCCKFEIGLLKY